MAVLVVRLASREPAGDKLRWHHWDEAPGAKSDGLPKGTGRNSGWSAPFKHLPGDDASPYFNAHVEQLLFPPGNDGGERWLCCPSNLHLELSMRNGGRRLTQVDLLERVTTPLEPAHTYGLIHLSLLPKEDPAAPGTLWWRKAIASPFRQNDVSEFTLLHQDRSIGLDGDTRPLRALVTELFGDPDRHLERSPYTVLMARHLPEPGDPTDAEKWRRALADPFGTVSDSNDAADEQPGTFRLGRTAGLLLGNAAAFTLEERGEQDNFISNSYARSFRSYWSESMVFGLMQHDSLEGFQHRLAAIKDLSDSSVEKLHSDWLKFRNVLWWSQLSSSSPIPQRLVFMLREELGTERLFTDLEGDLATYSAYQHQKAEDKQEKALANLQIYGAPLAVFGTLITAIGLFDACEKVLALLVGASFLIAIVAMLFVRTKLTGE
jgi:hypothetical protein